jgi:hypothetical protein
MSASLCISFACKPDSAPGILLSSTLTLIFSRIQSQFEDLCALYEQEHDLEVRASPSDFAISRFLAEAEGESALPLVPPGGVRSELVGESVEPSLSSEISDSDGEIPPTNPYRNFFQSDPAYTWLLAALGNTFEAVQRASRSNE